MEDIYILIIYLMACSLLYCIYKIKKKNDEYKYEYERRTKIEKTLSKEEDEYQLKLKVLRETAYTNTLTQLGNMDYFLEKCGEIFKEDSYAKNSIVLVNIMNIGKVNEFFGHTEGDRAIVYAANAVKKVADDMNMLCANIYNNIFAILTKNMSKDEIISMTSEITSIIHGFSANIVLEPSFGIYPVEDKSIPILDMINSAMLTQKFIKDISVCNYEFYTEDLEKNVKENKSMSEEMEVAMAEHKFLVYLQPMVDLRTFKIVSAEALVRWDHPERGILSPYAFLPLFETTQVMQRLDYYMWEECLKTIRRWIDNKITPTPIAINISPIHFQSNNFIMLLSALVEHFKVDKNLLILELPERGLSNESDNVKSIINELKENGFTLCIDNFGSKSSPLNMLRELPIDRIKIDRSFLNKNSTTEDGLTILRYLIAMAKEVNLTVITEGIESIEQANFLSEIGCDIAQGYFFSKPIDLKTFDAMNKSMVNSVYKSDEYYPTFEELEKDLDLIDMMIAREEGA